MNAVGSARPALWVRLAAASAACLFILQSPGCSGTVTMTHGTGDADGGPDPFGNGGSGNVAGKRGGGGSGNSVNFAGGGVTMGGGRAGGFGGPVCGNGVREAGEQCDGQNFGGETCNTVTMGAVPYGYLSCTPSCSLDTSQCTGYPKSTGGFTSAGGAACCGGFAGSAGAGGMMGIDPTAACYASGGVPDPSNPNNCLTGPQAARTCMKDYMTYRLSSIEPTTDSGCAAGCGCEGCVAAYDKCARSPDCMTILNCAESANCNRMVDCYQPSTCQSTIDSVGGQRGRAAIDMSNVLSCLSSVGCTVSCQTLL